MNDVFDGLYQVVLGRKYNPQEGSYTCYLFEKGLDKICKKVGEEAAEVIIAAKISEMKDGVVCSRCRTVNSAGTVYCKSCGNRLKKGRAKGE